MLGQTPKGFPVGCRPEVLRTFFKNGHSCKKDYGLEAKSLGAETMRWWEEIRATGGAFNLRFGGPTGIYNLVILMCWWCSLLRGKPDDELGDCFRTLEAIDSAILSVVHSKNAQPPPTPSAGGSSPGPSAILPVPKSRTRGSKRTISEEPSSRKRLRS